MTLLRSPLDWTNPKLIQLRDALVQVYNYPHSAKAVALQAGLAEGRFPHLTTMQDTWHTLLGELAINGILRHLVEIAASEPNARAYKQILDDILEYDRQPLSQGTGRAQGNKVRSSSVGIMQDSKTLRRLEKIVMDRVDLLSVDSQRRLLENADLLFFGSRVNYGNQSEFIRSVIRQTESYGILPGDTSPALCRLLHYLHDDVLPGQVEERQFVSDLLAPYTI